MGYTHYIYHKRPLTDAEWQALCTETWRIIAAARAAGIRLAGYTGDGQPEVDGRPLEHEFDYGRCIALNGLGMADEDHEPFILTQKPNAENREHVPGEGRFHFCKTARAPYDAVVVSILHAANRLAPGAFTIKSDGGAEAIRLKF